MADEGDDWFGAGEDDAQQELKPIGKQAKEEPPPAEETPAATEAPQGETTEEGAKPEAEDEYLDPDKLLLFKHWIRPKFLPYKYLYEYRANYYDDIMEVLESRRRGVKRDIPRAQTWAERICRQRSHPIWKLEKFDKHLEDIKLITKTQISGNFQSYFVKDTFNKRYSKLLY
ncbi:flightin isoform X2 [Diorhabda carinulata]|uniref:flightin isoform X2 n=1 Tax=Diorhabda carinulata TaxID=1163345 RepID=UPI0025A171D1|nr:flightin isoform X2 [Diorhabda carinulata]